MTLTTALTPHLRQGLKALYVLMGDEPLLIQEMSDELRSHAIQQGYEERKSFTVSGAHFDWSQVLSTTQSMGLFASLEQIEVHIPSGKPGRDGAQAIERLCALATELSLEGDTPQKLLLMTLPKLDKATQHSAWFECLQKAGVVLQASKVERHQLANWIAQRLSLQGQSVRQGLEGSQALQLFVDLVEGNLLAAHQEVQKLGLLYPKGELSLEQIQSAVMNVARFDVFKLSEAVLSGHVQRVQRMLEGLQAEGESAVLVHYVISEDIRQLCRVKHAIDAGQALPMALRANRVWGAKEKLFERVLSQVSSNTLERLLQAAHRVDGVVKGLKSPMWAQDAWMAMGQFAFVCTRACSLSK
jgi:DNA polymerase-3 subunit delta